MMILKGGVLALMVAVLGACSAKRVEVLAALTPVDAARPYFIYQPVKGTACGENATAAALDDLFRVKGADGFIAAVLEQETGGNQCVVVTARPITYGCAPRAFGVESTGAPQHVVPGPQSCPASADACTTDCAAYAARLAGGEFETSAFQNRCLTRCRAAEAAFMSCARAAASPADVRRCDALSP
jgi:hypothetical protein